MSTPEPPPPVPPDPPDPPDSGDLTGPHGPAESRSAVGSDSGHAHAPGQHHSHVHAHDHAHGEDHDPEACMVDAMEEQIMAEIAAQIAAGNAVACPLPTEATDFLYWPWIWRGAQVLLLTALAWQFWPAAEKISRVLLYLAAAATLVGTFVQVQKNSSASPEGGGWWRRWHAAVRQYPERFSGPLWLATGLLAGAGFYIASRGIDPGRSLNAFVEKFDALLIVLLSFVHFRFTVARRQPFWLMGLLAESWLIGLSAIGVLLLSVYLARFGWGALLRGGAHGPLTGWSMGYGTAFSHWMVLAGLLAAGRAAADPLFRTAAADPVTAARIKAARVLLWLGNVVFGCASVVKWTGARVTLETIGWPDVDHLKTWTSTVYEQAFGPFGFWSTTVFLVAALAVVAWLTWRALGQRLRQMEGPRPKMAAAGLPEKETPRWAAFAWLAPVFLPCCVAAWASQKETACVVLVAGAAWLVAGAVAAILSSRHHPDAADSAALPANSAASANPAEQVQLASEGLPAPAAAPAAPAAAVSAANPVIAAATGLTAPASATLPGEPSHPHRHFIHPWVGLGVLGALLVILGWAVSGTHLRRSAGYRRVWWDLTWQMIEARPAGYGFGAHIFRAEFHREFAATPAAAARLQAAIPPDLQPIPQPGWGPRDLAFHRKWLTWELSKGFDPHDEVLQVLFEGGWAWLALLAVGALGALWLRGGLGAGPSPVLDLLVAALAALLAVDIASGGLEKIAACIIAAWIAWGCRRS